MCLVAQVHVSSVARHVAERHQLLVEPTEAQWLSGRTELTP
jgi:hypothetical protein